MTAGQRLQIRIAGRQGEQGYIIFSVPFYGAVTQDSPQNFDNYFCNIRPVDGGEVYYKIDTPITGQLSVTMTPHDGDLDLSVIGTALDGTCHPTQPLEVDQASCNTSQELALGVESVTAAVNQGRVLFVVVDGTQGATSAYTLSVACSKE